MVDIWVSAHFTKREMECRHCGDCLLDPRLLKALEELRALGPEPIQVLSACRCQAHNVEVFGVGKSEHLFWHGDPSRGTCDHPTRAADIHIKGLTLKQQYERALQVPDFKRGGVGLYSEGSMHVDTRGFEVRWARVRGKYMGIAISGLLDDPPSLKKEATTNE